MVQVIIASIVYVDSLFYSKFPLSSVLKKIKIKIKILFGSRISLLSPNITSFMFPQVATLPPSGFYYLGHLQHTVRALCLISVDLIDSPA